MKRILAALLSFALCLALLFFCLLYTSDAADE